MVIVTAVGAAVSTDTVAGEAAVVPALPAASAQLATVKVIVPAAVLAGGVNVAVYSSGYPLTTMNGVKVPALAVTAGSVVGASLNVS